jgi:hypothetical protein
MKPACCTSQSLTDVVYVTLTGASTLDEFEMTRSIEAQSGTITIIRTMIFSSK